MKLLSMTCSVPENVPYYSYDQNSFRDEDLKTNLKGQEEGWGGEGATVS